MRGKGPSERDTASDNDSSEISNSVALFDDCAFYDPTCSGKSILGRVQRMRKKGNKGYVEYVHPVDLNNSPADVEIIVSKYCTSSEGHSRLYNHQETVVSLPLKSLICKINLQVRNDERGNDIYELAENDAQTIRKFLMNVDVQQRTSVTPRQRSDRTADLDMEDEGRRVDTVALSRGRLSRRVSYMTF